MTKYTTRREYQTFLLDEKEMHASPFSQFNLWFEQAVQDQQDDPTAMTLSTVDAEGYPNARVVLLKGIEADHFVFYTDYRSAKGREINAHSHVALTFYWSKHCRQVRIRGIARPVSEAQSDAYFSTRPQNSKIAAHASHQSACIESRAVLETAFEKCCKDYEHLQTIPRPSYWGGYAVSPLSIEFWQGRESRLHDRLLYVKTNDHWQIQRLCP